MAVSARARARAPETIIRDSGERLSVSSGSACHKWVTLDATDIKAAAAFGSHAIVVHVHASMAARMRTRGEESLELG